MKSKSIRELAPLYGVQLTYEDATGKRREASEDAVAAILRQRSGTADFREALRARTSELAGKIVEPVTVVWGSENLSVRLRLPHGFGPAKIAWDLRLEDGSARTGRIESAGLSSKTGSGTEAIASIDERLPAGYHVLTLTIGGRKHETFVIASPVLAHAPAKKTWGIFIPPYAGVSQRSWGAGDVDDLRSWREWVSSLGGGIVATLPLLSTESGNPSPYSPVSRLFWNEMYLAVERLPEFRPEDRDDAAIAALQSAGRIDYQELVRVKRRALERMAARFVPDAEYAAFAGHARDYAEFCAGQEDRDSARYHLYVQFRMAEQMRVLAREARRSGLGLYLDFPLGVNPAGYDANRYSSSFVNGVSVGAPPDSFFTKGQNWGFPPLDPDAIRLGRYEYFRACIRHHMSHAGILRLDHVMGLHRLYWIPDGANAKDGVYVRYPDEEMYAIVVLESNRARCAVVGEDLGTVPRYVPQMMNKHGLRRMYVVQYEIKPENGEPLGEPPVASVASVNTHDMPPFAAFWNGGDVDDRLRQRLLDERGASNARDSRRRVREAVAKFLKARGLLSEDSGQTRAVLEALLRFLGAGAAEIVLVNLEDLWLETEPQNVPGVPDRSWRQKFRYTLEQVQSDGEIARILRELNVTRRKVNGNQT